MTEQQSPLGLSRYYSHLGPVSEDDFFLDALGTQELLQCCADVKMSPQRILDFGARIQTTTRALANFYTQIPIVSLECSPAFFPSSLVDSSNTVTSIASDGWPLPFEDNCFDMITANLTLSFWPASALHECFRLLRSGGVLLLTCFGRRTLMELNDLLADSGPGLRQRASADVLDLGNNIVASGGVDPVINCLDYQLDYDDLASMRQDFRRAGVSYRAGERTPAAGLNSVTGRGKERVTVEIITAIAFCR